ncbi:hypothetical protein V8E51_017930 [Hyaloscypha variabilis]
MAIQHDPQPPARREPRPARYEPTKAQPRSRLMQWPASKTSLRYQSSRSSKLKKKCTRSSDFDEEVEPQRRRLSLYLNACNTILGTLGFGGAICFGVVTVVQADTANKEAKIANRLAAKRVTFGYLREN